ncbi:13699_t:CDS:2 [Cetraspora pellucida]|uniref:13699_t:CDS:1 n=1 Tax=Cetraspora pellucida TaxID=1433469 RepID=A0A9N8ZQ57_9GLOM|nr:13699_t:CDS:2 [Cetraspora pellucida]
MTVSEKTCQKLLEQLKQTEHMLQNSYMEYDNNKTQEFSTENLYTKKLSLGINLDNKK